MRERREPGDLVVGPSTSKASIGLTKFEMQGRQGESLGWISVGASGEAVMRKRRGPGDLVAGRSTSKASIGLTKFELQGRQRESLGWISVGASGGAAFAMTLKYGSTRGRARGHGASREFS